jgi:cation:H+ antiporter
LEQSVEVSGLLYNTRALVWLEFVTCLGLILAAGTRLTKYADAIAEKTSLGRIWIGIALVATITAMPEMATGISSATLVDSPDLAFGTLFGSVCFNLTIVAVLDVLNKKRIPALSQVSSRQLPGARWGIALITVAGLGLFLAPRVDMPSLGWLSLPGLLLLVMYPLAVRQILGAERRHAATEVKEAGTRYAHLTLKGVLFRFYLAALVVVAAGIWLSFTGDRIAEVTGWGSSFVGNLFLAIATSAPELVVAISAVRMGVPDIALGDILGANMLDTGMIGLVDLFYTRGSILAATSPVNLAVVAAAAVMTLIVAIAIARPRDNYVVGRVSWYGPLLIAMYLVVAYVLFTYG